MIVVERPVGQAEASRERVQLLERVVRDEVGEQATVGRPDGPIDEDHRELAGVSGRVPVGITGRWWSVGNRERRPSYVGGIRSRPATTSVISIGRSPERLGATRTGAALTRSRRSRRPR